MTGVGTNLPYESWVFEARQCPHVAKAVIASRSPSPGAVLTVSKGWLAKSHLTPTNTPQPLLQPHPALSTIASLQVGEGLVSPDLIKAGVAQ
jgi:hypothetical protein